MQGHPQDGGELISLMNGMGDSLGFVEGEKAR
jgi:hypothetical protein